MRYLLLLLLLTSCTQIIKQFEDDYYDVIDNKTKSDHLNLLFSHNINGEVHPCGCRNFPLGGIAQVSGEIHSLREKAPLIFVDTGDALFPSTLIPEFVYNSQVFTANKIAESFDLNGLDLFLPGDQDFAAGVDFLNEIAKKAKFTILLSNLKETKKLKSKPYIIKKFADRTLIFLGVLDPTLLNNIDRHFLYSPTQAIKENLALIKNEVGSLKDKTIILLSHSGMETDKLIAKEFPNINWIIGSHSQAFTQMTVDIGETKIVQVLSRNHYLGAIKLASTPKKEDLFSVIEVRDELKDKWKDNPMLSWLGSFKTKMDEILITEQEKMGGQIPQEVKAQTYQSCMECHTEQGQFWQQTSHATAFVTLENAKSANNPNCIGCHSLNYGKQNGFQKTDDIVLSDKKLDEYWKEWQGHFKDIKSIRKLDGKTRKKHAEFWHKLDKKHEVKHNFANVQCLNCHDKANDHPFEMDDIIKKTANYQDKCIQCHTSDQSPEWYNKDEKGIATTVNNAYVAKQIKLIACPKRKE